MARISLGVLSVLAAALSLRGQAPASISPDALRVSVSYLASDHLEGRATPSPGLDTAAAFIASQFERAGLAPAGKDGYFQPAPFVEATPEFQEFHLSLDGVAADPECVRAWAAAAADLAGAPAMKIPFADLGGLQRMSSAAGKVLLIEWPAVGALDAARRGAAQAAMRAARDELRRLRPNAAVLVSARHGRARRGHVLEPVEENRPDFPVLEVSDAAFAKAFARFTPTSTVTLRMKAPAERRVTLRNVVGLLRGSDPLLRDTYVLATAHYDHLGRSAQGIFHGANDNASGTASLIEIAAALAGTKPKRSLVFIAFFGEEKGLLGSRSYVRHPLFPLARTVANINLEHLGRTDDTQGPRLAQASLTGFDYTDLGPLFTAAGKSLGVEFSKQDGLSERYYRASDNYTFAEAGIPAHTVAVAYTYAGYHAFGDEWSRLDYPNMAKVAGAVAAALAAIANQEHAPAWNTANPHAAAFARRR